MRYNSRRDSRAVLCSICHSILTVRIHTLNGVICAACYQRVVIAAAPPVRVGLAAATASGPIPIEVARRARWDPRRAAPRPSAHRGSDAR